MLPNFKMALLLSSRACFRPSIAKVTQFSTTTSLNGPKVAVVLAGSGVFDGSEIHEVSACLVHLTRGGAEPRMYAPDVAQMHVVNHATGEPAAGETRNVLVESARIARGRVRPLGELSAADVDAVVFPGGFGAAKNLSNFATEGAKCKIIPDVERVLKEFHAAKKPMAFCCISPTLVAKVIPKVEITFGHDKDDGTGHWPYAGTADVAKQWGAVHHNTDVHGVVVDKRNLVVTTPAFMYETLKFHEIYDGIGKMIKELFYLIKK